MCQKVIYLSLAALFSAVGGWALQYVTPLTPMPAAIIAIVAFICMTIAIYKAELFGRKEDQPIQREIDLQEKIKFQDGSLNSVTTQDRQLILKMAIDMQIAHGHNDFIGMLADRASGVPLNKIMSRECSECNDGSLRNKKAKRGY